MSFNPVVRVRPHVINISFGGTHVYTFEPSGRLHAAFIRGRHYRRTLDHRILESWRVKPNGNDVLRQRWLQGEEKDQLVAQVRGQILDAQDALGSLVECIEPWTPERYDADAGLFQKIYGPVGILPPDQYMSVVIQATQGCPWNRCSFCNFYQNVDFRIKDRVELRQHIRAVKQFFGPGLAMRKSVFLADANAFAAPWPTLEETFEEIQAQFQEGQGGPSWRNVYGFAEPWRARQFDQSQLRQLRKMGLRRVYLGLETGHDALLERVNKRGDAQLGIDVVRQFKQAEIDVGVIFLLGLGGQAYAQDHVWDTVTMLNQMPLNRGDVIYFSPLVASSHMPYARDMWASNVKALNASQMALQFDQMVSGLRLGKQSPPKIAKYNIQRFVY